MHNIGPHNNLQQCQLMIPLYGQQVTTLAGSFTDTGCKVSQLCFRSIMTHLYRDQNGWKCYISECKYGIYTSLYSLQYFLHSLTFIKMIFYF
jgi:hypothetical protein